jgi:hypothetical protein
MTSKITCRCGRVSLTACGDRFIYLVGGLEWCCGDCAQRCAIPPPSTPEIERACIKPDHDLTEKFFHQLEQEFSHPTCR